MERLMQSILAAISIECLIIYHFFNICRIMRKEEFVEKILKEIFKIQNFNEKSFFILIRPIFLHISMMTFVLSKGIALEWWIVRVILFSTPVLTSIVFLINMKNK